MTNAELLHHQQNNGIFYDPDFIFERGQLFRISSFDFEKNLYYKEEFPNDGIYSGYPIGSLTLATGTQAALFLQKEKEAAK